VPAGSLSKRWPNQVVQQILARPLDRLGLPLLPCVLLQPLRWPESSSQPCQADSMSQGCKTWCSDGACRHYCFYL